MPHEKRSPAISSVVAIGNRLMKGSEMLAMLCVVPGVFAKA